MKIFRNPFEAGRWAPRAVVAIGKFDGMHLGHRELVGLAVSRAKELGARCLILTFDPSPEQFLHNDAQKPLLTLAEKLKMLAALGVDGVVLVPFTERLACMSPEAFTQLILTTQMKVAEIFVGEDFCFGKDRAGRIETLEELGPKMGFAVHPVPLKRVDGQKISSSGIVRLIETGKVVEAEKLLGWKLADR